MAGEVVVLLLELQILTNAGHWAGFFSLGE